MMYDLVYVSVLLCSHTNLKIIVNEETAFESHFSCVYISYRQYTKVVKAF